jgi:hypothetical protein
MLGRKTVRSIEVSPRQYKEMNSNIRSMTSNSADKYFSFSQTYNVHFDMFLHREPCLLTASFWFLCLDYSSTLKMEATCFSETLVDFQRARRRHIPECRTLHKVSSLTPWVESITGRLSPDISLANKDVLITCSELSTILSYCPNMHELNSRLF